MANLSFIAPAKLNLFLHVVGKRADGFHLLESLVTFADFGDELSFAPAQTLSLEINGPFAAGLDTENNLVMKAARLLQTLAGIQTGAHITLTKHIPIAAGLGGGSSDAAAALKGLAQLWNIRDDALLARAAEQLGSDVPACLYAKPAFITGVGEKIAPVKWKGAYAVLANPLQKLATASVFGQFSGGFNAPIAVPETIHLDFIKAQHNTLEKPAMDLLPVIGEVLGVLAPLPACRLARMSGSGATCFALFDDKAAALRAAAIIRDTHAVWWSVVAKI